MLIYFSFSRVRNYPDRNDERRRKDMEVAGVIQDILRVAVHEPNGRPRFLSSAIRRSFVLAIMGARAISFLELAPVVALVSSGALYIAMVKATLAFYKFKLGF